ncbi:hypothetical protein BOX15_Mlig002780g1 [Macrostomum lignano]|uniref:SH3 domain-containing protein n=1 Tax=Macrostomum lignano TaxID=282301 RepID=A0A267DPI7_9PLAT|nr:hypothetical protein BOX15_Mlig002780g1 [Macrostomum lignano]
MIIGKQKLAGKPTIVKSAYRKDVHITHLKHQRHSILMLTVPNSKGSPIPPCSIPQTYENLLHTVQRADADQDLRWWAQNHGDCMPVQWPQFEEFGASPPTGGGGDGGSVRGKKSGGSSLTAEEPTGRAGGGGNFRNSGHQQSHDVDSPTADNYRNLQQQQQKQQQKQQAGAQARPASAYSDSLNPFSEPASGANRGNNSNPFDDEMPPQSGDASGALEDDGRQGVPVRALYDYTGTEEDELSFQAGDVFEKLDDEDEQGWCKGRKDGRAGLYPPTMWSWLSAPGTLNQNCLSIFIQF